jgi:hypothetical protein
VKTIREGERKGERDRGLERERGRGRERETGLRDFFVAFADRK